MANISVINKQIDAYRVDFDKVLSDPKINFEKEAMFATQIIASNDYVGGIAMQDLNAFRAIILNVAAFGITLNPASKLAYLVPRNRKICLDISYMGLMHIAQQTGAIQWCQSSIVRANDKFARQGIDKAPLHEFNDFDTAEKGGDCRRVLRRQD